MTTSALWKIIGQALCYPWGSVPQQELQAKRLVAGNGHTVEFCHQNNTCYGSIHTYAKVEDKCVNEVCSHVNCCSCDLACQY